MSSSRAAAARSHAEQIVFVADRPATTGANAADARKLERELGWRPAETFASGIRKTVRWYAVTPTGWPASPAAPTANGRQNNTAPDAKRQKAAGPIQENQRS